jgi:hypothetical protein
LTVLARPAGVVMRGHWYGAEELARFRRRVAPSAGVR